MILADVHVDREALGPGREDANISTELPLILSVIISAHASILDSECCNCCFDYNMKSVRQSLWILDSSLSNHLECP